MARARDVGLGDIVAARAKLAAIRTVVNQTRAVQTVKDDTLQCKKDEADIRPRNTRGEVENPTRTKKMNSKFDHKS